MEINLRRHVAVGDATIGTMTIGDFTCYTLEDVIRDKKVWGKTAIPAGIYPVLMCESPRFTERYEKKGLGRIVPLLDGVPEFTGVRIHVGNVAEHSHGCILVGVNWDQKSARITGSETAFKGMMKVLNAVSGNHRITIVNDIAEAKVKLSHPPAPLFNMMYRGSCFPA
jgi:hypothetical protein